MPQQNTHKQRKDEALRRHKQRKERLYQQKQQQKQQQQQPPARPTQQAGQPQPQPQQPARQPTVILPNYTDRAKKLGELIALYLRGNWNWNDGMQMARQYAPHGTTEAELRAAVMHAAKVQGNTGNLAIRALVQPEVVHPEVNISDLPKQSTLQNVARGLQAPLRSVAARATQQAGKKNPRGQYGKESGGKPFPAPQSFAESYASDPTFGSALELAFPDMPQWFRVLVGGALDFTLDPINLLGAKPVKTVVSTVGKQVGSTRAVQKVAEPVRDVVGAVGTRVMHPTAAKQVAKQVPAGQKAKSLRELGEAMERVPIYSFTRSVGKEMQTLREELDDVIRRANERGINIPKSHTILDFEKYLDEIKQENISARTDYTLDHLLKQDLNQLDQIEAQIRAVSPELADEVQKLKSAIEERSDAWYRHAELVDTNWATNPDIRGNDTLRNAMWEGARAVFRREILPSQNILNRVLNAWKRTKTIYNLGTQTRNFFQNFLFRYLTGDVDVADLLRLPQAVRDMIRFRRMVEDVMAQSGNANVRDYISQRPDLLDIAYILSYSGVPQSRVRDLQQMLTAGRVAPAGVVWEPIPTIFPNRNSVRNAVRLALSLSPPNLDHIIRTGTLVHETGIPIRQLPRNWLDVLLFPFRRAGEITREVRAKELPRWQKPLDWLHTIAQRSYNAGDLIPALLMEATRRRKALMSDKPVPVMRGSSEFRMDYSTIPETIGALNIALLPFFNYQYFALRGLREALRKNPERVYNIVAKPVERSTRITQADDEHGVSQAPRFGFAEREMYPVSPTHGIPYSSILPIDVQFAEPLLSLSGWVSRSPITAIARPFVENRDDSVRLVNQLIREFTPASITHALYALMGEPQRGLQPTLRHTRGERLLRAIGINIQPVDAMRIARQQQRQAEQQRREPLYEDPATITGIVNRILRSLGW